MYGGRWTNVIVVVWRDHGLVPIAYEDYGGSLVDQGREVDARYAAVAVARRRDTELTLFNLKRKSWLSSTRPG